MSVSASLQIMVVEDDLDLLGMVERYLRRWNFAVDPFSDPLEALAHFEKNPERYSLVITDIKMPQMNGIQMIAQELKKHGKVVICCSAGGEQVKCPCHGSAHQASRPIG